MKKCNLNSLVYFSGTIRIIKYTQYVFNAILDKDYNIKN